MTRLLVRFSAVARQRSADRCTHKSADLLVRSWSGTRACGSRTVFYVSKTWVTLTGNIYPLRLQSFVDRSVRGSLCVFFVRAVLLRAAALTV